MKELTRKNTSIDIKADTKTLAVEFGKAVIDAAKDPLKDFFGGLIDTGLDRAKEIVVEKISNFFGR